jgi:2'-5' RNA ligase
VSRLFVAAELPAATRRSLVEALPRCDGPGLRWVPPEQWHVTLRFLGEVAEGAAVEAVSGLVARPALAVLGPRVERLGRAVVCVPVDGLDGLATAVLAATAGLGRPPERPFAGHLTLGRRRDGRARDVLGAPVSLSFPVPEVVLVRSTLDPVGARHEALLRVPLVG